MNKDWILVEKTRSRKRYRHRTIPGRFALVLYQPRTIKKEIYQDGKLDDPEVTKQPPDADNYIEQFYTPDANYGTLSDICVYARSSRAQRSLLKFDFSADVPAGSTIGLATLSLYGYGFIAADPIGRTYWAYQLTQTAWTESGSTWNKYDGTNLWTTAGGDYTTTDGASLVVPQYPCWFNWTVTAQVQTALDSVSGVAHFLLKDGAEDAIKGMNFYSKEYTTDLTLRPKLYIEYSEGGVTTTQSALSLSRIKVLAIINSALSVARIKILGLTKTALSLARIKSIGIARSALSTSRIKIANIARASLALARIKVRDITKNALSLARLKMADITSSALSITRLKVLGAVKAALSIARISAVVTIGFKKMDSSAPNKMIHEPEEMLSGRLGRFKNEPKEMTHGRLGKFTSENR